ncbi:hypothetical protein ACOKFD_16325 [Flagellimonas sp. S174]|uniref:hypothetical protein n=1 Tax=Flagellimonas sp. S174 TaxID=3410790 RepID=UPI003BF4ED1D
MGLNYKTMPNWSADAWEELDKRVTEQERVGKELEKEFWKALEDYVRRQKAEEVLVKSMELNVHGVNKRINLN